MDNLSFYCPIIEPLRQNRRENNKSSSKTGFGISNYASEE